MVYLPTGDDCDLSKIEKDGKKVYIEFSPADQTEALKCFPAGTYTAGTSGKFCPIAFAAKCAAAQACESFDGNGTTCPSALTCLWPQPTHLLMSEATFESYYKDYDTPSSVYSTLGAAITKYCPVYSGLRPLGGWTKDGGATIVQGWPVRDPTKCDAKAIQAAVQGAIDAWNETADASEKYKAIRGSYDLLQLDQATEGTCYEPATNKFHCSANGAPTCTMLCSDGTACNNDGDCGGKCAPNPTNPSDPEDKICVANAFTAFVAPVIAAALAIAFF